MTIQFNKWTDLSARQLPLLEYWRNLFSVFFRILLEVHELQCTPVHQYKFILPTKKKQCCNFFNRIYICVIFSENMKKKCYSNYYIWFDFFISEECHPLREKIIIFNKGFMDIGYISFSWGWASVSVLFIQASCLQGSLSVTIQT